MDLVTAAPPVTERTTRTADERKTILARALQHQCSVGGRVESSSDFQAVVVFGQPVNHLLHFLIGVFTIGAWWIVWLLLALGSRRTRRSIFVDESGRVTSQDVVS